VVRALLHAFAWQPPQATAMDAWLARTHARMGLPAAAYDVAEGRRERDAGGRYGAPLSYAMRLRWWMRAAGTGVWQASKWQPAVGNHHVGKEMHQRDMCMSAAGWVPRSRCVSVRHHGLMVPLPVNPRFR